VLLDIDIYPLVWPGIVLDGKVGADASTLEVSLTMVVIGDVDYEDNRWN